jgi:hypothetical protein
MQTVGCDQPLTTSIRTRQGGHNSDSVHLLLTIILRAPPTGAARHGHVARQVALDRVALAANGAGKRLLSGVGANVGNQAMGMIGHVAAPRAKEYRESSSRGQTAPDSDFRAPQLHSLEE